MMKLHFVVIIALLSCWVACIAGPTPHPGAPDQVANPNSPGVPGAGDPQTQLAESNCEQEGGMWDGDSCVDGNDSSDATLSNQDITDPPSGDATTDADTGPDDVDADSGTSDGFTVDVKQVDAKPSEKGVPDNG
jgi:hypothetical protein